MSSVNDPYSCRIREIGKEKERELIRMNIIIHYMTPNMDLLYDRCDKYNKAHDGCGNKNFNVNKLKLFKDIPDGVEILIDYVDATALRTMTITTEIIYESIYRELPELFEE